MIFLLGGGGGGGESERESKEEEKERESNLLSTIHRVMSVGICRGKNQSSLSQRGLRVGTKNEGF